MGMEGGGIPVFDGEGYEIWSKKMMTLFVSLDLWNLVQQGYEEEVAYMAGLGENRKKDCKALYIIQQGVSNRIFPVIMKANTSKEAWEAIRDRFHHEQIHIEEIEEEEEIRDRFYHDQHQQIQIQIEEIEEEEEMHSTATIRMEKIVSKLSPIYQERCIFRVPDDMRKGNEGFYEPKVLSIGPYHRGKPQLDSMEKHKKSYQEQLLKRKGELISVEFLAQAVKPHEKIARICYDESIDSVSNEDLIQMLVLDGCFIIEFFLRMGERRVQHSRWFRKRQYLWPLYTRSINWLSNSHFISSNELIKNDPVINSDVLLNALQNDLLLVENQIPFFIIQILYGVLTGTGHPDDNKMLHTPIIKFLCRRYLICELLTPIKICRRHFQDKSHLLEIVHEIQCPINEHEHEHENKHEHEYEYKHEHEDENEDEEEEEEEEEDEDDVLRNSKEFTFQPFNNETFCSVNSATKLKEGNVKLKPSTKSNCSSIFDITFSNGELSIPSFNIDYHFEFDISNFIALEMCQQHHKNKKRYFCDYVVFMDHLIESPDDVKLLIDRGIIINKMIDAKLVDNMFQRLTKKIKTSDHYTYNRICTELNEYCARPQNKWNATLKHKYFQNPWTIISFIAASMLLTLTIAQTLYSILSYYK